MSDADKERIVAIGKILDGLPLEEAVSTLMYNLAGALGQSDKLDWEAFVRTLKFLVDESRIFYEEIHDEK
jgi:hypothetical protein